MPYRIWDNGIIRDATEEELEQMRRIPPPIQDSTEYTYKETDEPVYQEPDSFEDI